MKTLKIVAVALILSWLIAGNAHGQTPAVVNNMFTSPMACVDNLDKVPYYVPKYMGNAKRDPVNGTTKIAAPTEGDSCVYMETMQGWKYVPIKSETILRWNVAPDGTRTPYAHDQCGNKIGMIFYPAPPAAVVAPAQAPLSIQQLMVSGIPDNIAVNVSGGATIAHGGEIRIVHSGEVAIRNIQPERGGFPWKKALIIGAAGSAAAYAAYYYWPCPPGTERK